jgi:protein-S-isoprenylcysteine O-methyltransferase Ste14
MDESNPAPAHESSPAPAQASSPAPAQESSPAPAQESSPAPPRDAPGVIAPPPFIFLAGLAVGFGLEVLLPGTSIPDALAWILGGALVLVGLALLGSFVGAFRREHTPVDPYSATTAIVTDGPYRFTRNPGYLGMALVYIGIAVLSQALWMLLPLPVALAIVDRGVIEREERYLEGKFGQEYVDYKRRVRRWV